MPNVSIEPKTHLDRATYLSERAALVSAEVQQAVAFDKALMTLSGGALALSLTFWREVVKVPLPFTKGWLVAGWVLMVAALGIVVLSMIASQSALRRQRDVLVYLHNLPSEEEEDATQTRNRPAEMTHWLNASGLAFFMLGLCALMLFAALNL